MPAAISRVPTAASAMPRGTLIKPSTTLSVSNCRTMRPRPAPSAVRTAYLAAPARGPRQEEIGDVRAGDEQHERDAGHHQIENERDLIGQKRLAERAEVRAPPLVRSRVLAGQAAGDRVEVLAHAVDGHARLHPAKRKQAASAARIPRNDGFERNPEPLIVGKSKPGRHHANHDVRRAVDQDRCSDNLRVTAVAPGPQVVTEQHDRTGSGAIVLGREAATENRRRSQQWKQVPRNGRAQVALGLASAVRNRQIPPRDGRNRGEDRVGLLPIPHVEIRQAGSIVGALILRANHEDPVWIGVWVWLE